MAELTLKDESVLEIGKSVSQSFEGLASTGKSLLVMPDGQPLQVKADDVEVLDERPQKGTAQVVFEKIRDGVNKLVEVFTSSLNFQKQEAAKDDLKARISEGQSTEEKKEDTGFFTQEFKDKISELTASIKERTMAVFGSLGDMLKKGGLLAVLAVFAFNINKFSGELSESLKPVLQGFKRAFKSLSEDIFPIVSNVIKMLGASFESFSNLLQGLFEGDGSKFFKGLQGVVLDLPLRIVSIVGDSFFSLVDAFLKLFGVESETIQNIKLAFRTLPEAVKKAINDSITFITETIPQYFEDLKNQAIQNVKDNIDSIKQMFKDAFNFITEDIPNYFGNLVDDIINSMKETINSIKEAIMKPIRDIKDKVSGFFGGIKDFFTGAEEKAGAGIMSAQLKDKSNAGERLAKDFNENKKEINQFQSATGMRIDPKSTLFNYQDGGKELIFEDPRSKVQTYIKPADFKTRLAELIQLNTTKTYVPNMTPKVDEYGQQITPVTPKVTPQDLEKGKQLNTESAALNSGQPSQNNMQVNNGGTTNNTTANNTYNTILEDTATSDRNLRQHLNA